MNKRKQAERFAIDHLNFKARSRVDYRIKKDNNWSVEFVESVNWASHKLKSSGNSRSSLDIF